MRPSLIHVLGLTALLVGCSATSRADPRGEPKAATEVATTPASSAASTAPVAELPPVRAVYPWAPSAGGGRLDGRFREPMGFHRVPVGTGSFGEFLRTLPLMPEGSPVVDFRGRPLHDRGGHPNIVAVADLDVGSKDLQHCADVIIRLHAEWRYGRGERDLTYRAVSGQALSYRAYLAGDRSAIDGKSLVFRRTAAARKDEHAHFREWLDDVFAWAGTASLERDGKKVPASSGIEPGDFFVMSGNPYGHAVLVLDVARDDRGRTALLLGQSYMPAQTFQILRPDGGDADAAPGPWFILDETSRAVDTPFWRPFPMSSLRRL
jgi:hypothetical protein